MDFFKFAENRDQLFQQIREVQNREFCYEALSERIEPTITGKKYGIGGQVMLRGALTPNFLEEHVIGRTSRGRLCTKAKDPTYIYYFDDEDRLVKVDWLTEIGVCTEYIIREGNVSYGFHFSGRDHWKNGVYAVILEDGHIGATIYHQAIGDFGEPTYFDTWTFEYAEGRPVFVTSCNVWELPDMIHSEFRGLIRRHRLEFDEKDQIVRYHFSAWRHPDRDEPRPEQPFDLARPIPPKVWRQTYGLI